MRLEARRRTADTRPVSKHDAPVLPAEARDPSVDERLTACELGLSVITVEMHELVEQLGRLRSEASPLVGRVVEQDSALAERDDAIARLRAAAATRPDDERLARVSRELEALRRKVDERERELSDARRELALMAGALASRDAALDNQRATIATLEATARVGPIPDDGPVAKSQPNGHIRLAAFPEGYRLFVSDERCVIAGDVLEVEDRRFVVTRVGHSPLPADARPCAFLALADTAQ